MRGVFDVPALKNRILFINKEIEDPNLWDFQSKAQSFLKEKSLLENKINEFINIAKEFSDLKQLHVMASEESDNNLLIEIENLTNQLLNKVGDAEIKAFFKEENDCNDCFIDINAGAGGTDSCDFVLMLVRMYQKFCLNNGFDVEIVSCIDGDEAGIKSVTIKVSGDYAYGWLKPEIGIHRLVRISPFNANAKRQTSFASVWVYPLISENIEIEILEKDLRIDTYRASGAGGQHVNKTDSAVRITHIPTNTVVQCQSDRSQIRNRATALNLLKAKLYELEIKKKKSENDILESSKKDNSWGNQIRSYVLHPYQMVKDLRTSKETGDVQKFLDGEIKDFIKSYLIKSIEEA